MKDINIIKVDKVDKDISDFIADNFESYSKQNNIDLNYDEFCFVAKDVKGDIIGAINGRTLYNEVHIKDLIIHEQYRKKGIGTKLIENVENTYRNKGYKILTLTTFNFQAPEFYQKIGFEIEFIREVDNPKLNKYFFKKEL